MAERKARAAVGPELDLQLTDDSLEPTEAKEESTKDSVSPERR